MARKFGTHIDLQLNQLLNVVVQVLAGPPTAVAGRVYYDSTLGQFGVYDGVTSAWVYAGTGATAATTGAEGIVQLAGDLGGTGTTAAAPTVGNLHLTGDTAIGHRLTSVSTPTAGSDAATKDYVDAAIFGLKPQTATYVTAAALPACTGSGTGVLTVTATGVTSIDGTNNVALNDVVLVNNQVATKDNGRYTVTTAGASGVSTVLTRTVDVEGDAATWAQQIGQLVAVAASDAATGAASMAAASAKKITILLTAGMTRGSQMTDWTGIILAKKGRARNRGKHGRAGARSAKMRA